MRGGGAGPTDPLGYSLGVAESAGDRSASQEAWPSPPPCAIIGQDSQIPVMPDRNRLVHLLREQVDFLEDSGDAFDRGKEHEAKRISAHVRVLLHDTRTTTSLLQQMGVKDSIRFLDTAREAPPPGRRILRPGWSYGLVGVQINERDARHYPNLGGDLEGRRGAVGFADWWTRVVAHDVQGREFTREQIVLWMANKDGGAHVDPRLPDEYVGLLDESSLGSGIGLPAEGDALAPLVSSLGPVQRPSDAISIPPTPLGNFLVCTVRQIGYEVAATIRAGLGDYLT